MRLMAISQFDVILFVGHKGVMITKYAGPFAREGLPLAPEHPRRAKNPNRPDIGHQLANHLSEFTSRCYQGAPAPGATLSHPIKPKLMT